MYPRALALHTMSLQAWWLTAVYVHCSACGGPSKLHGGPVLARGMHTYLGMVLSCHHVHGRCRAGTKIIEWQACDFAWHLLPHSGLLGAFPHLYTAGLHVVI